jgi:predicted Zn finger-like uncharacterized protein
MRSPKPMSIIIACPHCGTRYQVPPETLGDAGRRVACAHCGRSWMAEPATAFLPPPEDDRLFSAADETALDKSFAAEEAALKGLPASVRQLIPRGAVPPPEVMRSIAEIKAALERSGGKQPAVSEPAAPKPPSNAQKQAEGKLAQRQRAFAAALPATRFHRILRGVGVGLLIGVISGAVLFRGDIVRMAPDLAGLYAAIGLEVNVVGLDFSDVSTLLSRRGDADVISVTATIYGVEPRPLVVPPVVVTLLGDDGAAVYAWSVMPKVRDLEPGETIGFSTELASPPKGAKHVRLSFADSARAVVPQITGGAQAPAEAGVAADAAMPVPNDVSAGAATSAASDTHEEGSD